MDRWLNIGLLKDPLNYFTIAIMCLIALTFLVIVAPEIPDL